MLIIINDSITDAYVVDRLKFKNNLNHILNAHFNKKHFVYITPVIARKIKLLNSNSWGEYLSSETIIKIDQIAELSILNSGINSSVNIHMHIYYNKIKSPVTNVDAGIENASVWKFTILSDLEWIVNPTYIYGENIHDSTLFESIAKATALKKGFKVRNIKFRREMTGGCGNIKNLINTRNNDPHDLKSPCFFIADSDYKYPRAGTHHLRKANRANLRNYNNSVPMGLYILKSREVENSIPIELLLSALHEKSLTDQSICDALIAIDSFYTNYPEQYKYIDIKEGTCLHAIRSDIACRVFFSTTQSNTAVPCSDTTHTKCFQITPKLGDIVLSTLNDYIALKGDRHLSKLSLKKNTDEWEHLEELLFSISLCNDTQPM